MKKVLIAVLCVVLVLTAGILVFTNKKINNADILSVLPNARGSFKEVSYKNEALNTEYLKHIYKLKDETVVSVAQNDELKVVMAIRKDGELLNVKVSQNPENSLIIGEKIGLTQFAFERSVGKQIEYITFGTPGDNVFSGKYFTSISEMNMFNEGFNAWLFTRANVVLKENFQPVVCATTTSSDGNVVTIGEILSFKEFKNKKHIVAYGKGVNFAKSYVYVVLNADNAIDKVEVIRFHSTKRALSAYALSFAQIENIKSNYENLGKENAEKTNATNSCDSIKNAVTYAIKFGSEK